MSLEKQEYLIMQNKKVVAKATAFFSDLLYIQRSFFNVLMVNKTYPEHSLFLRLFAYNSGRAVVFLLKFASSSFEIRDEIFMHSFSKE